MNVVCKVCDGKGKVDKDFACGKCKELDPKEYFYRECPACNGTGMQFEKKHYTPCPPIIFPKPCPKKHDPLDPWKIPYPGDPYPTPFPMDPFRHPRRKKRYWRISGYTSTT